MTRLPGLVRFVVALVVVVGFVFLLSSTTVPRLIPVVGASPGNGSTRACSDHTLNGRYGFVAQGTVLPPLAPAPAPVANSGVVAFDGRGQLRGFDAISLGGQIFSRTFEGTYTVREDCAVTGSLNVITGTPGLVINFQAVIVDNGREVLFVETDPSTIYTGTLKEM
jgi:hypothetical protein